jgi:excisionase family DNA binding protein
MRDGRNLATSEEVAEYLAIPARTLDEWAHRGTGPAYRRVGKYRRYRWSDVDRWFDKQRGGGEAA